MHFSLSWFLTLVIVCLLLLLLFAGRTIYSKRPLQSTQFKKTIGVYAFALCLVLVWMIWHFIGWRGTGSSEIPRSFQQRFAHTGYYFGRSRELSFRGATPTVPASITRAEFVADTPNQNAEQREIIRRLMPAEALEAIGEQAHGSDLTVRDDINSGNLGFANPALQTGELLTLKPIWIDEKAQEWSLSYRLRNLPLRISATENGEPVTCANIPSERWLESGDTIFITRSSGNQILFTSFKWTSGTKYWWPFERTTNSYYYGEGTIEPDGSARYTRGPDALMSEVVLTDGAVLANLVRRANQGFRQNIGSIEEEWWDLFGGLTMIRERRGDRNSKMGLMISDGLLQEPDVQIYINYSGSSSQPISPPNDNITNITVPTGAVISYGLRGRANSFELKLPGEVTPDRIWGQIVRVPLVQPKVWPVPPEPHREFIVTSSNEYIPLDGYLLETGNPSHSFYAKGQLNGELDELSINDGKNVVKRDSQTGSDKVEPRRFELGESATLGDYEQGVLFGLLPSQSLVRSAWWSNWLDPKHTGRAAILLLFLNAIFFLLLLWKEKLGRPTLLLAWAMVWGIALAILCIRLILIYRISLVPPLDASVGEVRNVFDKGVDYALLGLLIFAVFTAVLNFARRRSRQFNLGRQKVILLVFLWAFIVVAYTVAGAVLGANQSFLGVRISIADHLLIVGGLALLARHLLEHARALTILLILLTLTLEILVVKDSGSIIYGWSFLFVIIAIWGWRRPRRAISLWFANTVARYPRIRKLRLLLRPFTRSRVSGRLHALTEWSAPILIPIAAVSTFLFLPYVAQFGVMRKVVAPAVPNTAFYRFASFTDSEEVMLTTKSGEEVTDMSKLLDNSLQHWQMLLYASRGVSEPVGYGRAPLSKTGMTYPTSVSDCAFATYVMAEHGRVSATLLLVLYLLLACACVIAAWHFDDNLRHRNIVFMAIAGFFILNALYMASANVGLMTFTGQNLPLLGLASGGDLLQGLFLLCLAGWLLLNSQQESRPGFLRQRSPVIFRWGVGLCIVSVLWLFAVMWRMGKIEEPKYRNDHELGAEIFEQIARNLQQDGSSSAEQNAPLVLRGDRLEIDRGGRIMEIEEQYRKQFNERTDKFNPQGGLYYLEPVRSTNSGTQLAVKVNKRFFFARSPFTEFTQWRGRIVAAGDMDPTLYALGSQFKISLSEGGLPASIDLAKPAPGRTNSSVLLGENERQFFQLARVDDTLTLHPKNGDWSIFVNGELTSYPVDLEPLSIIVIERRAVDRQRRNLIYLGPTGPILAYVRWRNGGFRRMFPEGGIALPYFLGKTADRAVAMETEASLPENERIRFELRLTIDLPLHKQLQRELEIYAGRHSNYRPYQAYPNRLSATVIDAFEGRVLAIPTWPRLDPNKPQYEALVDKLFEPARSRFENNGNLVTDHVVGSTIKPIVFATLASEFWPERDLARLLVFNRTDNSRRSNGDSGHPHWRVGGINIDVWNCHSAQLECGMSDFVVHSLDYPQGLLAMWGLVRNKRESNQVLMRDDERPDISYDNTGYRLDLGRLRENSIFTLQDQDDGKLAVPLAPHFINQTLLFSGLNSIFNFETAGSVQDRTKNACSSFIPIFANSKLSLARNEYLDNVLAKRLEMNGAHFMGVRQGVISCFLGGAPCTFNNIMMAEAGARLATGKRVFATIEASDTGPAPDLSAPLSISAWRNENVLMPMEMVGRVGTANAFTTKAGTRINLPPNYRMIYKTGTMVEGNEGRESEALMFVIGRWENSSFVRNKTVAGFIYMEKSKNMNPNAPDGNMKKFEFAAPLLNAVIRHLLRD